MFRTFNLIGKEKENRPILLIAAKTIVIELNYQPIRKRVRRGSLHDEVSINSKAKAETSIVQLGVFTCRKHKAAQSKVPQNQY